jgi:hypothetical protein
MKVSLIDQCKVLNINNKLFDNSNSFKLFIVKRIYYLYNIPNNEVRGGHAHKNLSQIIIPINGSFDILIDDAFTQKKIHLNSFYNTSLYFPPGIWRELSNFTSEAICLVLASEKYIESDYIRDYQIFRNYKQR